MYIIKFYIWYDIIVGGGKLYSLLIVIYIIMWYWKDGIKYKRDNVMIFYLNGVIFLW